MKTANQTKDQPMAEVDGWGGRKKKLNDKVQHTLERYRRNTHRARRDHAILSVVVIVGAVLSPILTTLATKSDGLFSIVLQGTSIVVGLSIAVSEGLRRLIRPEARWKATAIAIQQIVAAREAFRDATLAAEVGSPPWLEAYKSYRERFEAVLMKETVEFFPDEPDKPPKS